MRPDEPQGRRARNRPSVAEISNRAEEPPRPRHPFLEPDGHRVHHRHTQSLPEQQEFNQRGDYLVQDDPNTYQDGHRRYHSSVIGRVGPYAPDNISTPSLRNYQGIPTRARNFEPLYLGTQYSGGPQYPGPHYRVPQYPGLQYTVPRHPGIQYPGLQYPGAQYPGAQYPDLQSTVSPHIHGLDSTYRPIFNEYGIPQAIDDIPGFQEALGQSSSTINDQMFAGSPDPQAGIPNSMAPFDSTSFQQGYINTPYLLPDPGYSNHSQEQGVSRDPFQSLLSTPYLLPAPLPSSPSQQPAITQDSYQLPSSDTPHLDMPHGRTRNRAARSQGSNLRENQITVNPRELNIVEHDLQGPSTQSAHQSLSNSAGPADQTLNFGERHGARDVQASAIYDPLSDLPNPGSDQQLHTPTRQRVSHHQGSSHDSQGQDSGKRKRRAYSSPEAGPSPRTSSPMASIAGRRQGQNPKNGSRIYFHPQQEKQTPTKPDTSERHDQTRRLIIRRSSQSGTPPNLLGNDSSTSAMADPETLNAATGIVVRERQKPYHCVTCGKRYGSCKGLKYHQENNCKREDRDEKANRRRTLSSPEAGSSPVIPHDDQNDNGNNEQQHADDAQKPSLLDQDSGSTSRPPRRLTAKKRRSLRSSFFTELDACNGVITPSKLEPGQAPKSTLRSSRQRPRDGGAQCPICEERFGRTAHLRQHFVACVKKNGNPDGHYWDDMLEDK